MLCKGLIYIHVTLIVDTPSSVRNEYNVKVVALFLSGCERLAVLLQQRLDFCPPCQAVGFPLEPAVFSSSLPLQNLQHPREEQRLRVGAY